MLYLIGQIALTIFFTALIGITMGWLLRGLGTARQIEAVEARWRARVEQLERRGSIAGTENRTEHATATNAPTDASAARKIASLQEQIRQRDSQLASLREAPVAGDIPDHDSSDLATRLRETAALCTKLQKHVAEQRRASERLTARIEQADTERGTLIERLRDRESEIGRMSQERQHAINTIASLQKEMRRMRGERSAMASAPDAGSTRQNESTPTGSPAPAADSSAAASRPDETQTHAPPPAAERQQSLPIAPGPESDAISRYEPKWRLGSPQGPKDNLQAILGIGPKLETQLNRLGIYHFEQIGQFQRDDIVWVAHHLKSFPGRIVRDRWIEQAQTLANQRRD